jgi:circadian clock protein KaiC
MSPTQTPTEAPRVPFGVDGLDNVLGGGLPSNRFYLVQGDPGVGKTTLALHFLLEGVKRGESVVYITLSETEEELHQVALSHGWSLDGVSLFELSAEAARLNNEERITLFQPAEVELGETTQAMMALVDKVKPRRVVLDSLSEMRLLAQGSLRYRRQILALKQFFAGGGATVLMLDDRTSEGGDLQLQSLAHGVIELEQTAPEFGAERRRMRVVKLRGARFRGGYHDFTIKTGGVQVFPRLVVAEHREPFVRASISSGLPAFDALLGGGLDRGTSTLLIGPAGCGKSTLATHYANAMANQGENAAIFAFDEGRATLLARSEALGMDLRPHLHSGRITVTQVDPAELSPGEFIDAVRKAVEQDHARMVIVDSLNGFMKAMLDEKFLTTRLHEMLSYLAQRGVVTILVLAQHGLVRTDMQSPVDVSYLADTVLLMRYFEAQGEIKKALSVLKKRTGAHETNIRELRLGGAEGVHVGRVLREFRGVMTGVPEISIPTPLPGEP